MFICIKQRTTSLFLFLIQQLCYSLQNKNFSIIRELFFPYSISCIFQNLNEDLNGGVSSRRYKENYMVVDDEDSPSNSNSVNGVYNKVKVPPDKTETNIRQHIIKGKSVVSKLYNRTSMLRLEELDFVPACEISTKEAISAIHRAKTQLCKQQLVNITCLSQEGLLYPTHLPSSCPAPGIIIILMFIFL